jgi:hypothetical protein
MCEIKIPFTGNAETMLAKARDALKGHGKLEGDASKGTFAVTQSLFMTTVTIKGTYAVSNSACTLKITEKPGLVTCAMIEQKLRSMLKPMGISFGAAAPAEPTEENPFDRLRGLVQTSPAFRGQLEESPVAALRDHGIDVEPEHEADAAGIANVLLAFGTAPSMPVAFDDPDYAKVEAGALGIYITLSDKAVKDVINGLAVGTALVALVGGLSAPFVGANAAIMACSAAIGVFIGAYAALLSQVNRGNGVVLFASWLTPVVFVPSAR